MIGQGGTDHAGETEVHHHRLHAIAHQDVGWLEVAVQHAGFVRGSQATARGAEHREHVLPRAWALHPRLQRLAGDELHHDVDPLPGDVELLQVLVRAHIEDLDHVAVVQLGHDLRLTAEAQAGLLTAPARPYELDRDITVEARVVGLVHHAKAPRRRSARPAHSGLRSRARARRGTGRAPPRRGRPGRRCRRRARQPPRAVSSPPPHSPDTKLTLASGRSP